MISLQCKEDMHLASFEIDEYVAGFASAKDEHYLGSNGNRRKYLRAVSHNPGRDLTICNKDDMKNAICYENSNPTAYEKSKAVARLIINGSSACTGWLVGAANMLLTNAHCIKTNSDALNTDFEFMVQDNSCQTPPSQFWQISGDNFDAIKLILVNEEKDYALIQLGSNSNGEYASEKYGYVRDRARRHKNFPLDTLPLTQPCLGIA